MRHTLVIGFGNLFRRDDGVAHVVINELRERLDRQPLGPFDDGFDELGHEVDTVVMHQLVPELAETVAEYDLLIFVDAHTGRIEESIHAEWVEPVYRPSAFVSHQTHPSTVLALSEELAGRSPDAVILSLRGYDFDFGEGLTEETAALVDPATDRIMKLIEGEADDA